MIRESSKRLRLKASRWTVTEGLASFEPCDQSAQAVFKALELLNYIKTWRIIACSCCWIFTRSFRMRYTCAT